MQNKTFIYGASGIIAYLLLSSFKSKSNLSSSGFNAITLVDDVMQLRGCDPLGCGNFGASRGSRTHNGIDIACLSGSNVYAPLDCKVIRTVDPYGDRKYSGIELASLNDNNDKLTIIIMYMNPDIFKIGQNVKRGDVIGSCQDITVKYPGITPHLHIEMLINNSYVDPTELLFS
ncbi:MAG: M23 family metallopeptidase [Saprospiraceae bacterium]|nr:M23 family metallopeptidase [Saprospiraceae bacterium]